jgi:SET domain-containing protein
MDFHSLDARNYSNVTRFINHSCSPNLETIPIITSNLDRRLAQIAFFAKRDIEIGEELTTDYQYVIKNRIRCECKSRNCRGWLC